MAINEKLKENYVPRTLFVGLGGTGSSVVQMLAKKCRGSETDNVSFVVLDTNVNDLEKVSSGQKIYAIQTSSTQSVGDYLNYDRDALNNWFPKNPVLYDKTVSEGAGQVRAISRLAFNATIKTGRISKLYEAIDELFRKDGKELKQALRVVLVATAAGGTGSGIVVPISMFIRNYINEKYPNTAVIIRGLLMLPEILDSVIKTEVEKDSLRRNAYATVKEINAFMMKGSGFFDIEPELQRYRNMHIDFSMPTTDELKSLDLLPFDFCFLFDGQNAEDNTLTSTKQYKEQAAQALYEQNIGPMQEGAFSIEDNIIKEISNKGNYGRNRFGGIGAGLLRYPYPQIVDYVAYQWAIDRIGGQGEAASWTKYDRTFDIKRKDAKKKGLSASEMPKIREVYVESVDAGSDNFSRDLRNMYLSDADELLDDYMRALDAEMAACMTDNANIRSAMGTAGSLKNPLTYEKDDGTRGNATANLGKLRSFEMMTRNYINKVAKNKAEAIFQNESHTINAAREANEYTLEYLFTNKINGVVHPNAMRYFLYSLEGKFEEKIEELDAKVHKLEKNLSDFSQSADRPDLFDAGYTKKSKESNFDSLCAAEKDPSFAENLGGYEKIYDRFKELFPRYYKLINDYGVASAQLQAYKFGLPFVQDLNHAFEAFYASFPEKVTTLTRKQDDLVTELKFKRGDSVLNICASESILKELAHTATNREGGLLLPSDLNAQIFDAIKFNVVFDRETANDDVVDDKRINIFDDILSGYFQKAVDETCKDTLDLNIIQAIAMEYRLKQRIKMREDQEASGKKGKIFEKADPKDVERYIKKTLATGMRLGAPGIQRIKNVEPREINLVAYNKVLLDMRNYDLHTLVPSGMNVTPTDTISRYEMHFFNAIYNLTPDKLQKFACPFKCETGEKEAGLYHNAYQTYTANIGPDTTKSMTISTHIDKRWDSISFMPELDLDFQAQEMMHIHEMLVYGLVHGAIQYRSLAPAASDKRIYKYETSDERMTNLVVSNGTPCDEFYEVLDSLYIDHSVVQDIQRIHEMKTSKDRVKNSNYEDTLFAKDLENFCIESVHAGPTSLLEIPLVYHNSLPNSLRYTGEIASIVNAVINVLRSELTEWERGDDVPYRMCNLLRDQFNLLMDNFEKYEELRCNTTASENPVLDVIYRKIKKVYEEIDCEKDVEALKARLK